MSFILITKRKLYVLKLHLNENRELVQNYKIYTWENTNTLNVRPLALYDSLHSEKSKESFGII